MYFELKRGLTDVKPNNALYNIHYYTLNYDVFVFFILLLIHYIHVFRS